MHPQNLPGSQIHIGAVEDPRRPIPHGIARKYQTQQAILTRLVIQARASLGLQRTVQAVLVKAMRLPAGGILRPSLGAFEPVAFLAGWATPNFLFFRSRCVECGFGVNRADQVKVAWQRSKHTFATVQAVDHQQKVSIRKPSSDHREHLGHQFGTCFVGCFAPLASFLGGTFGLSLLGRGSLVLFRGGFLLTGRCLFGLLVLTFGQPLSIAIQPHANGERKDFRGSPPRVGDDDAQIHPVMTPVTNFLGR
jgi:hypothetical protein